MSLRSRVADKDSWPEIVRLFGEQGACAGCWCQYFFQTGSEFERSQGQTNRDRMEHSILAGEEPGLLAFDGDDPVGWIAVAPRERYGRLARSRIMKPVDDLPVWSIVCQFVARGHRHQGVSLELIRAALKFVKDRGGRIVEAYAVEPRRNSMPDAFAYPGLASTYLKMGFHEVARRSETRPILRYDLDVL